MFKIFFTISWTCNFVAFPMPVTDFFTTVAAYSATGKFAFAAQRIAIPLPSPTLIALFMFLPKKISSTATFTGLYSWIILSSPS